VPTLALTATATPRVLQDVMASLGIGDAVVHRRSFDRPNLSFQVVLKAGIASAAKEIAQRITIALHGTLLDGTPAPPSPARPSSTLTVSAAGGGGGGDVVDVDGEACAAPAPRPPRGGSAVVYVHKREEAVGLANELSSKYGISAVSYHAGMSDKDRGAAQLQWTRGRVQCVVATVAFGMVRGTCCGRALHRRS